VSVVLTSLLLVGGVFLGRWIATGGGPGRRPELPPKDEPRALEPLMPKSPPKKKEPDLVGFPCALGDVVARVGALGEERWLAGAIVFSEERPAGVLFVAPEAGGDRAVFAWPAPSTAIVWLEPVAREEVAPFIEPPTSLEVHGMRYERARRLPLRAQRIGAGAPDVGDSVSVEFLVPSGPRVLAGGDFNQ